MKYVTESLKYVVLFIEKLQGIFYSWQILNNGGIMQIGF